MKTYSSYLSYKKENNLSKRKRHRWLQENGYFDPEEVPRYAKAWKEVSEYFNFPLHFINVNGKLVIQPFRIPSSLGDSVSLTFLLQLKRKEIECELDPIFHEIDFKIIKTFKSIKLTPIREYCRKDFATICFYLKSGKPVNFMMPVCPDWAFDPITKIYTFDSLNSGIGLIAQKALGVLSGMIRIFSDYSKQFAFHIVIGDAMGLNPDQLQLAKVKDFAEFKLRCIGSRDRIQEHLSQSLQEHRFSVSLMSDIMSNQYDVKEYREKIEELSDTLREQKIVEIFGSMKKFDEAVAVRKPLYTKLYPHIAEYDLKRVYSNHLAEYNMLAEVMQQNSSDMIILGFDSPAMHYGYKWYDKQIPVLSYRELSY